ncbi:MAG: hypothetical protein FJ261_06260 [Planctomycetes bacterium]|nr:hypothetical protein [Planctomycetota bacterium]
MQSALTGKAGRQVFLIVDGHPIYRSNAVRDWVERNSGKISLHQLPRIQPRINPDELLNNGVKSNAMGRRRPRDMESIISGVRSYL